ncbi:hypothetical protein F9C07_10426 [Aspergillus flavus]|uniref:Uncharacterized protein n=1 Tax=Aspergillus flavus (strain ATCC 200026 / FGSC A1120 / IAM 13836 / NRRL 3357 / JCM 12722 / SRRC 167) TaxID=332952 RepID=A0A7U2QZV0_ASPFN|nr:hypothetical protein F9C07_10426 [Aspergillus flavus]
MNKRCPSQLSLTGCINRGGTLHSSSNRWTDQAVLQVVTFLHSHPVHLPTNPNGRTVANLP